MSTTATPVPPYVFAQQGDFDAPFTFDVPATLEIRPDTAHATFDGTNASGDFLACLSFYDNFGNLLARQFSPTPVVAGDVAQVTFIPPFGSAASGSAADQEGLHWGTNTDTLALGLALISAAGYFFQDTNSGGFFFISQGGGWGFTDHDGGEFNVVADSGGVSLNGGTGGVLLTAAAGGGMVLATGGELVLGALPTVNPGGSGQVWNNAGVLNIT